MSFEHGLCALGVLLSLLVAAFAARSKYRLPFRNLNPLWIVRLGVLLVFWTTSTVLVCILVETVLELDGWILWPAILFVGVGFILPCSTYLNPFGLRHWTKGPQAVKTILNGILLCLAPLVYVFDDVTSRAEREANKELLHDGFYDHAIDRLFEHYMTDLALVFAPKLTPWGEVDIRRLRERSIKLKYLYEFLTYSRCREELFATAMDPLTILPTWDELRNRRKLACEWSRRQENRGHNPERRIVVKHGRRKGDIPPPIRQSAATETV